MITKCAINCKSPSEVIPSSEIYVVQNSNFLGRVPNVAGERAQIAGIDGGGGSENPIRLPAQKGELERN